MMARRRHACLENDALMHWDMTHQIKARELNLVSYEDEDGES
jgi:hypothetical protein